MYKNAYRNVFVTSDTARNFLQREQVNGRKFLIGAWRVQKMIVNWVRDVYGRREGKTI